MDEAKVLTWAMLLGKWTEFAQSALALPKDGEGGLLRASVPDIIGLQAITHALGELDVLTKPGERALALDRAAVGIRGHAASLHAVWTGKALHPELRALIDDAFAALAAAREGGLEWCVGDEAMTAEHPAQLVESLAAAGFSGDLFVPTPGVVLFPGCPAVFVRGVHGERPGDDVLDLIETFFEGVSEPEFRPVMRQAYRQFDFGKGRAVRDLVVEMTDTLPGGQPLLVPAMERGKSLPVTLPPRRGEDIGELPVVFGDPGM